MIKITVYNHQSETHKEFEGPDEESIRNWLNTNYPWLEVQKDESLHEIIEDLRGTQNLDVDTSPVDPSLHKSEPDGVEALLDLDNPLDRRLALKSRHVEPFHLRHALQDEDPSVRLEAALHPAMTPELIREAFKHDDPWLRQQILKRPDLRPEELEVAMEDPELWYEISTHPALTPELRNKIQEELKIRAWVHNLDIDTVTDPKLAANFSSESYHPHDDQIWTE